MKELATFFGGPIFGGLVTAVGAGRFDRLLAIGIGLGIGLVFIIGLEIFFIGIAEFVKWLEKRITQ